MLCREKWSLFDESSSVPLLVAHPDSPFKGQHYPHPVELLDVYPTVVDLLNVPIQREKTCAGKMTVGRDDLPITCHELQGKSFLYSQSKKIIIGSNDKCQ